jgi:hypothetical protein
MTGLAPSQGLARLKEGRAVRTLAQFGDAKLERAEARVETALAVAIAIIKPVSGAFVPTCADQPFGTGKDG